MRCDYCDYEDGHTAVCPMTSIHADPNRLMAFNMGSGVAISDWVDSLLTQPIGVDVRAVFIESLSLLVQYQDRLCARKLAEMQANYDGVLL